MGCYNDYIIECDHLAFSRMLNEWKEKRRELETELPKPDYVWERIESDSIGENNTEMNDHRYVLYFCVNHGPYTGDVNDWLYVDLGLDERHFMMMVKYDYHDEWITYGNMDSIGGYRTLEYDKETWKIKEGCIPDGWQKYDYCRIVINPDVWELVHVDYTSDIVKTKIGMEDIVQEILFKLESIDDTLTELCEHIIDER